MDLAKRIEDLIAPTIEDLGFEIVRVQLTGSKHPRLQVMAERVDGSGIDVEDCAKISRSISAILDVEDPIASEYALEVSSPGIDRPLTRVKDFETWAGFDAKVELSVGIDGRKRFSGRLLGVDDTDNILMEDAEGENYVLPFDDVQRAKLLLTDELMAAVTSEQTK
ncbi:ribosome maturation factor RimP [Magnetovibrio sp. PR-2]|uniref:ribosome maturation factor RimP n=1 Tax=Magnetovibrio sp. PR-2 TaxID=3120356 RepID=UPI002FCE3A4C